MKVIIKIGFVGLIGLSALVLSGCDENSMLKPAVEERVTTLIQNHLSKDQLVSCSEYGTDPDEFEDREPVCSKWMDAQYNEYIARLKFRAAFLGAKSIPDDEKEDPTFDDFIDPELWQIIWDKNGKRWTEGLKVQKEQEKEWQKVKEERERYCQTHKNPFRCWKSK